jgi:hypothetical protein
MTDRDDSFQDLQATADRLRAERPEATAHELDRVLVRVRAGARGRRAGGFWRSRAAVVATLVLGMLLSTSGASLAISGFASESGTASEAQYGGTRDEGDVLGDEESGSPGEPGRPGTTGGDEVQERRQVEAGSQGGGEQLPFTGFAAIPILVAGVALLAGGLLLRRDTARAT